MKKTILVILFAFMASACGDDPTSPAIPVEGTYVLQTVDGQSLPFTLIPPSNTTGGLEVTGGSFTLREDSTYNGTIDYGVAKWVPAGQYAEAGDKIVFGVSGSYNGAVYEMARSGKTLTWVSVDGNVYVFKKD